MVRGTVVDGDMLGRRRWAQWVVRGRGLGSRRGRIWRRFIPEGTEGSCVILVQGLISMVLWRGARWYMMLVFYPAGGF